MFDSPLSASAYEVLGVAPDAADDDLRRAYRLRLRETHPDTGGDAALFIRVQRAWELVGTPEGRAAYDRGRAEPHWAASAAAARTGTRPRAQMHGRPGGWRRRRYLDLLAAHLGHAVTAAEAYDPAVVRQAPWEARRMLADALAEEATALAVQELGMGFTAWHAVAAGAGEDAEVLDHVVLSPSGLYALTSEDFGESVRFRQGEVIGRTVGGSTPVADLLRRMRFVARAARVRFGGAILILPDDHLDVPATTLGSVRGVPVAVVRRSALRTVLRSGIPGARPIGGNELYDVRTRMQHTARLV
ncbi:J domain-containing protein [Microbacterium sp.]|uniref:J domain-containing protein n=1 Tax=Microbacterium sp. TaxID=51671 RepID=UPI002811ACCB|nr:DnaJ domain-containing protein [Microbacterium sp.]